MLFFLPLLVHILAALTSVIVGIGAFIAPKRRGRHPRWGNVYLWAYSLAFLASTIVEVERWHQDAYLFFIGLASYGLALVGYAARISRRKTWMPLIVRKQWLRLHILGMIGSYVGLLTAFFVDNFHEIPLLNRFPALTFWVLPSAIGLVFVGISFSRSLPKSRRTAPVFTWKPGETTGSRLETRGKDTLMV